MHYKYGNIHLLKMSHTLGKDKKVLILSFVTAATTVIAGIMHLQMVPQSISHDLGEGVLFLIGGILQVFWAVPVIKRWGKVWQIIGIVGTMVFFILWYASRLHLFPEGNMPGGTNASHVPQREFPQGNTTREFPQGRQGGGEFTRGPPRGVGIQIGGLMVPPIEIFQIAFICLYAALAKMISKKKT